MKILKAVFLTGLRKPLEVRDIEVPEKLEPHEVLIKQKMTGVCYRDILTADGFFPRVKIPIIPGHEIAGTVVKVGDAVKDFKPGDYVASLIYIPCGTCRYCRSGMENLCRNRLTYGEDINGSYAEYVKVHENSLVKVPSNVPIEGAVIGACVTGMIYHALKIKGGLTNGETVLITGAGGGVGIHAVQIAKALGAKVIAVTTSEWKTNKIASVGADYVVVSKGAFSDEIKKLTNGEGVDLVLETVGQPTFEQSFRSVRWGGRIIVVGNVNVQPVNLNLGPLILRGVTISGSVSSRKTDLLEALKMTAEGKIKPIIHDIIPLEQAQQAHDMMRKKESLGRVLLKTE